MTHRGTGDQIFFCRFCAATYGVEFHGNLDNLYRTHEEWETHLAMFHPRKEGENAERESNG